MHRAADHLGADQDREVFRVRSGLQPEGAADVVGGDMQALVRHAQDRRHTVAQRAGALRAGVERIGLGRGIVARGGAARLHRGDHDALMHDADAGDVLRRRDQALDLGGVGFRIRGRAGPVDRDIAGRVRPELRRARLCGLAQADRRRMLGVVDLDQLGGVLGGRQRLANDRHDRFAHVHHAFARQGRAERHDELLGATADQAFQISSSTTARR